MRNAGHESSVNFYPRVESFSLRSQKNSDDSVNETSAWSSNRQYVSRVIVRRLFLSESFVAKGEVCPFGFYIYIYTIFLASIFYELFHRLRCHSLGTVSRGQTHTCCHKSTALDPIASPIRRAIRNHRWHGASSGCWQRAPPVNAGCDEITLCQRSQKLPG